MRAQNRVHNRATQARRARPSALSPALLRARVIRRVTACLAAAGAAGLATAACAQPASAPPAAGGAESPEALRQAYLDAVRTRRPYTWAALLDTVGAPAWVLRSWNEQGARAFTQPVVSVTVLPPDSAALRSYAEFHAHFAVPVLYELKAVHPETATDKSATVYFVGRRAGRYYFVTARPDSMGDPGGPPPRGTGAGAPRRGPAPVS